MRKIMIILVVLFTCFVKLLYPQVKGDFSIIRAEVDFDDVLREWDGFGFNYVQVCQTTDYDEWPQEYGGFSILSPEQRNEILDMIFGDDGLKPGLIKMFLDPLHEPESDGSYDHETTTKWMRYFVQEGLKRTRARGEDLKVLTTLYGPPAWATMIRKIRGRDLDPSKKEQLATYIIDWVRFLKKQDIPVKYVSLHNQGDKPYEWAAHGLDNHMGGGNDYNGYWPPEQVVDFLTFMRSMMDEAGLEDVGLTPGECSRWHYFDMYGYAAAIYDSPKALANLGLITSHGFHKAPVSEWFGEQRSAPIDLLRSKRPDLHAWVGSSSWLNNDVDTIREIYGNIYTAKVNGYIPWAGIQRPAEWLTQEWNPKSAFRVFEDSTYRVLRGYYYYKQVCRAGQPGMSVCRTIVVDKEMAILAFGSNNTQHPDAFVVINQAKRDSKDIGVEVNGSSATSWRAFRTTDNMQDEFSDIGPYSVKDGILYYTAPPRSCVTFFAE